MPLPPLFFNGNDAFGQSVNYTFKYPTIVNTDQSGLEYRYPKLYSHGLSISYSNITWEQGECNSRPNELSFLELFNQLKGSEKPFQLKCLVDYKLTPRLNSSYVLTNDWVEEYSVVERDSNFPSLLRYRVYKVYSHFGIRSYKAINHISQVDALYYSDGTVVPPAEYVAVNVNATVVDDDVPYSYFEFTNPTTSLPPVSMKGEFNYLVKFKDPEISFKEVQSKLFVTDRLEIESVNEPLWNTVRREDFPRDQTSARVLRLKSDSLATTSVFNPNANRNKGKQPQTFTYGWRSEYSTSNNTMLTQYKARNKDSGIKIDSATLNGADMRVNLIQFLASKGRLIPFKYAFNYLAEGEKVDARLDTDELSVSVKVFDPTDDCKGVYEVDRLEVKVLDTLPQLPHYATSNLLVGGSGVQEDFTLAGTLYNEAPLDFNYKASVSKVAVNFDATHTVLPLNARLAAGYNPVFGNYFTALTALQVIGTLPINKNESFVIVTQPSGGIFQYAIGVCKYNWTTNTTSQLTDAEISITNGVVASIKINQGLGGFLTGERKTTYTFKGSSGTQEVWLLGDNQTYSIGFKVKDGVLHCLVVNRTGTMTGYNVSSGRYLLEQDLSANASYDVLWAGDKVVTDVTNPRAGSQGAKLSTYVPIPFTVSFTATNPYDTNTGTTSFGWVPRKLSGTTNGKGLREFDYYLNGEVKATNILSCSTFDSSIGVTMLRQPLMDGVDTSATGNPTIGYSTTLDNSGHIVTWLPTSGKIFVTIAAIGNDVVVPNGLSTVSQVDKADATKTLGMMLLDTQSEPSKGQLPNEVYFTTTTDSAYVPLFNTGDRSAGSTFPPQEYIGLYSGMNIYTYYRSQLCDDAMGNIWGVTDSGKVYVKPQGTRSTFSVPSTLVTPVTWKSYSINVLEKNNCRSNLAYNPYTTLIEHFSMTDGSLNGLQAHRFNLVKEALSA